MGFVQVENSFSRDVTAAMLVFPNNRTAAMLVYQTELQRFLSFRWKNKVTDHVSENTLSRTKRYSPNLKNVYFYCYCFLRTKERMHNEVGTCSEIVV